MRVGATYYCFFLFFLYQEGDGPSVRVLLFTERSPRTRDVSGTVGGRDGQH